MWQGAWRIAKHEFKMTWRGYLFTFLFLAYVAFFTTLFLYGHLIGEIGKGAEWSLDLAYFTFMPLLGFLLDSTMFRYRKEDTYSRKLAEWQTMPISVAQIIAGRLLLFLLVLAVNSVLYFGLQYAVLQELREKLDAIGLALYFLTWYGYGIIGGTLMVFLELGFSGRVYFKFCFVYLFGIASVTLLMAAFGYSAVLRSIEAAAGHDWNMAAEMLLAAAIALAGFGALLQHRINRRSLWT